MTVNVRRNFNPPVLNDTTVRISFDAPPGTLITTLIARDQDLTVQLASGFYLEEFVDTCEAF